MSEYIFFEEKFVPAEEAKIHVKTHSLHYGTAIFEGIRGNWNSAEKQLHIFRMREHYERMNRNCKILQIKIPYDIDRLCELTVELLVKNELKEDVYIRPLAYKNDMPMDQRLHVLKDGFLLLAMPYGSYLGSDSIKCCISTWRRPDFNVIPPQMKAAGLYINSALAKTEAVQNGFDEAILLSPDGFVSEGSGENIFIVMEGKLITPPTYSSILKGITRDTIMKMAKDELGVETIERPIDRGEIYLADECFMCGTGAHLVPVNEIDHRTIGNGEVGQITKKLMGFYHDVIKGNNSKYIDWCTPVF